MILWIDAQISPALASWITSELGIESYPLRDLGLLQAKDPEIYQAARAADTVIMTKDKDFSELQSRFGSPPQVLWLTCGNTSNVRLQQILQSALPIALDMLERGESLVEISDSR